MTFTLGGQRSFNAVLGSLKGYLPRSNIFQRGSYLLKNTGAIACRLAFTQLAGSFGRQDYQRVPAVNIFKHFINRGIDQTSHLPQKTWINNLYLF